MEDDQDRVAKVGDFPEDNRRNPQRSRRAYNCHKLIHRQPVKEHGDQYPTGGNSLSATEGPWVNKRGFLKRSCASKAMRDRSAITENSGAEDRSRGDQEDDKMNQVVNDLLPFEKMPQPAILLPFLCELCYQRFSSREAREEHETTHDFNWWFWADLDHYGTREGGTNATGGGGGGGLNTNNAEAEQHKCNICGSIFPTGQALGEHKCHDSIGSPACNSSQGTREGSRPVLDFDLNEPSPARAPADSSSQGTGEVSRPVLVFDLNEPPPAPAPADSSSQGTGEVSRPVLLFDLNEPPPAPVEYCPLLTD